MIAPGARRPKAPAARWRWLSGTVADRRLDQRRGGRHSRTALKARRSRLSLYVILWAFAVAPAALGAAAGAATPAVVSDTASNAAAFPYRHGTSYIEPLKYPPNFTHFEYVNPDAPKGGLVRYPDLGTYDSFNNMLDKGRVAAGYDFLGVRTLVYDRLLEQAIDENASYYGRLADGVWISGDLRAFAFRIRDGAHWHDGRPITADDVVWTFETYRQHGSAGIRTALRELDAIERVSDREVHFTIKAGVQANPVLPLTVGSFPILPKHYWAERDITKTTVTPPLGSGPYKLIEESLGRYVVYERVADYWGRDLPVNRGRYNFDRVKFDYFRDEAIMLEALKGGVLDIREETVAKHWANDYNFPAVKAGYFNKEMIYLRRPWGMWWPPMWNLDRTRFQDIRVREALWLMYDFKWINRVLMFGVYNQADSFFYNSDMASSGLPSADELALLEPFRDQVPERVFTTAWKSSETTGADYNRGNMARALQLFAEAGWEIKDGVLTHVETGEPFTIDFIFVSSMLLRGMMPFVEALNRIGIQTTARSPEVSNWLYRMRTGKFDGGAALYIPNNTPGLALRNWFSSMAADQPYSQNWSKIRNPVVDHLIDTVMAAHNEREFYAATRALDRVLLWNFYWIPGMAQPGYRSVHWDKFGKPEQPTPLLRDGWLDTWWFDEAKAARVRAGMNELTRSR